ncbi:hypothetical protein ACQ4PT_019392 [Festuca glaucescens]
MVETASLEKGKAVNSSGSVGSALAENVTDMMRRLNLTPKEAEPFILEDEGDVNLPCLEWALIGKVMSPNTLHVQTIMSVVRPAWGNPKGMKIRPMGPNIFLAEFSLEADILHVLKGGPWMLNKHAILLKLFDHKIKPMDVVFDQLFIWARIMHLDYAMMNSERGTPLAGKLGSVEKLEVDENGRAWGSYLRARVMLNPTELVMRCISVFSRSKNKVMTFDVMYERMPMFCFSCGLIGHSSLVCSNPAERDREGKLPWHGEKLCVPNHKKKDVYSSGGAGQGSGVKPGSSNTAQAKKGTGEVTSPMKETTRGRKAPSARKTIVSDPTGKDKQQDVNQICGRKRKQNQKVYRAKKL